MKREYAQLLNLINSALWEKPADAELFGEGTDWKAIYRTAQEQASLGLAYQGMTTLPDDKKPNKIQILKWYGYIAEMENHYNHQISVLTKVYELFAKEKPILLKGLSVAALYPTPHLRQLGDIDLLLPNANASKITQLLKKNGLCIGHDLTSKHADFELEKVDVELHWQLGTPLNPFRRKAYQALERQFIKICRHTTIEGIETDLLPLEFCSIFLLIHMVDHFSDKGLGLRQICDWALFLNTHHQEMDKKLLEQLIDLVGMKDDWLLFSYFCVKHLNLNREAAIFFNEGLSKKAETLCDIIFSVGNFGQYNPGWEKKSTSYLNRKVNSLRTNLKHFYRVFSISPSNAINNLLFVYLTDAVKRLVKRK